MQEPLSNGKSNGNDGYQPNLQDLILGGRVDDVFRAKLDCLDQALVVAALRIVEFPHVQNVNFEPLTAQQKWENLQAFDLVYDKLNLSKKLVADLRTRTEEALRLLR